LTRRRLRGGGSDVDPRGPVDPSWDRESQPESRLETIAGGAVESTLVACEAAATPRTRLQSIPQESGVASREGICATQSEEAGFAAWAGA